jgi:hypothetical protein
MSIKALYVTAGNDYDESATGVYETSEYVSSSAGAGDAGKPVVLDAGGQIDGTMIDPTEIDHDQLLNFTQTEHRIINDAGTSTTELWSANKIDTEITRIDDIFVDTGEPTGFVDRSDSSISFVDGTRTFTITRADTEFEIYSKGVLTTITSDDSVIIDNVVGLHYIYYTGNTLAATTTYSLDLILGPWVFVAAIYWNGSSAICISDERHGCTMDGVTHSYLHSTINTAYESGFAIGSYTENYNQDILDGLGAENYLGGWNASTNSPSLSDGSGTDGDYYIVTTAGSTSLDGISSWAVGDYVIAGASAWTKTLAASTPQESSADDAATVTLAGGVIWDEDLRHVIVNDQTPTADYEQDLGTAATQANSAKIPVWYRTGASGAWTKDTAGDFFFKNTSSGRVNYNLDTAGTWSQQEATDGYYVEYYIVATSCIDEPIISVQGINEFSSQETADSGSAARASTVVGSLPIPESLLLYRVLVKTSDAFAGETFSDVIVIDDFRQASGGGGASGGATDHNSLTGRTDAGAHPATAITTSTSGWTGTGTGDLLGATDTTVQAALGTLHTHHHDDIYFRENEYISTSAGAGDAGKPIITDAGGQIDASFIDDGDIAHDSTSGAAASTVHTAFPLLAGGRDFTGIQEYDGTSVTLSTSFSGLQIPHAQWTTDQIATFGVGMEWQDSVINATTTAPPVSPSTGDRYLVAATATGAWAGQEDSIAEWDGSAWVFTAPSTGMFTSDDTDSTNILYYSGSAWVNKYFEATTAGAGIAISAFKVSVDYVTAGTGTGLTMVGAGDTAKLGIDYSTAFNDEKPVRAQDLASTSNGFGASIIGIEDSAGNIDATTVEGALAELASEAAGASISSPDGSITVVNSNPQDGTTIATTFSTSGAADRSIEASSLASTSTGEGASMIGIEDSGTLITATTVEGALAENRTAIDAIEDNTITSPNSTINVAGTVGGDNQTVDIDFATTFVIDSAVNKAVSLVDLSDTANGKGASIIGVEDSAGYFTATDVEGVLAEIGAAIDDGVGAIDYTAGTGGVTIGDLVYISAADTVLPVAISNASLQWGIGVASSTEAAAATVTVFSNDMILAGVLTSLGVSGGETIYWNAGLTTTKPTGSGARVWVVGYAKNANDLHIDIRYVKRNQA